MDRFQDLASPGIERSEMFGRMDMNSIVQAIEDLEKRDLADCGGDDVSISRHHWHTFCGDNRGVATVLMPMIRPASYPGGTGSSSFHIEKA